MQLFQNTIFLIGRQFLYEKVSFLHFFSDVKVHCENGDLDYKKLYHDKKQDHLFARMVIHLGCHDKF